ncbi:MAG: DUF4149 domain-containing protein [Vampirovibrionales bacterium]|nr:DUF4149 domain-containing protein [Vampirovibrionales bacterium]
MSIAPSTLLSSGNMLQTLGLALMAGGMLAIGAFCAPAIFKAFPRHEAGAALTVVFTRYDLVLLISLGLVLLGEALRYFSHAFSLTHPLAYVRYALLLALTVCLIATTQFVNPKIERMQAVGIYPGATAEGLAFIKTHKLSENLYKLQLLLVVGLIFLTPWLPTKEY